MKSCIFLLIGLFLSLGNGVVRPIKPGTQRRYICPPEFVRLGNGCYYLSSHISTWQDAHFSCKERNSTLLSLDTKWKDRTMRNYLNRAEFARLERWIGGLFDWSRQQWVWGAQGAPVSYLNFGQLAPVNAMNWHCIFMDPLQEYNWNHKLCVKRLHYICETSLTKVGSSKRHNPLRNVTTMTTATRNLS
ncbi:lithostathine-1-beta-like [Artemia franciscana]|uniref:lithostathine-1-beta-like n=1 Tax=Artemia franciscana TaxID=6661 RepID=UPI0032DB9904